MKNIIVGLLLGVIGTYAAMTFLQTSSPVQIQETVIPNVKSQDELLKPKSMAQDSESKPLKINDVGKKIVSTVISDAEIESLSAAELKDLVRDYQAQVAGLTDTVKTQKQAMDKLNDERERRRNPLEEENLTPDQASAALNNIRAALETADPEYKEVLESALNLFQGEELETPSNDALLRHYSEERQIQWATSAQAWLQSYFQSGVEPDISLIQLNCRTTYCELYGFYGSDVTINDYRQPAAKISNFFRQMSDGPGYANLFRNAENISLNTSSDNTFMSFHVFIRSVN